MDDPSQRVLDFRLIIVAIVLFAVSIVMGGAGISYAVYSFGHAQYSITRMQDSIIAQVHQQNQARDARWCIVLDLLTRTPVGRPANPKADPSREESYQLYTDFVQLRKEFRCPSP